MEKIRPILAGLNKHHFWLLCIVTICVMLYSWNSATSEVKKQFQTNKGKVETEFQKLAALGSQPEKPNESWEQETEVKTDEVVKKIEAATEAIARSQAAAVAWNPESFDAKFIATASSTPLEEWDDEMIDKYIAGMQKELVRLRKLMGAAEGTIQEGVQWDGDDYQGLKKGIEDLRGKDWDTGRNRIHNWRKVIWLYETMAKVVGATNQFAKDAGEFDAFNPPIHRVVKLQIPKAEDIKGTRQIRIKGSDWQVRGAEAITQRITPPLAEDTPGYLTFAVAMQFRMDTKRIRWLQTACANSELPIDIRGVRLAKPRRLKEVEPPEDERRRVVTGRAAFPGRQRVSQKQTPQDKAKEEENKPQYGRGTLVEIYGIVYIAKTDDVDTETVAKSKPAAGAVVGN
ncbi:MAG: hypothetical protein VB835_07530 [Pirellulales bacterium]